MRLNNHIIAYIAICICTALGNCYADDVLEDIQSARKNIPEAFKPGYVKSRLINGIPCYVICGSSQRLFKEDANVETDSELYKECETSAKTFLLKELSDNKPGMHVLEVKNFQRMYFWRDQNTYIANFYVPEKDVSFKKVTLNSAENEYMLKLSEALKCYAHGEYEEANKIFASLGDLSKYNIQNTAKKSSWMYHINKNENRSDCLRKLGLAYFYEENYLQAKLYFEECINWYPPATGSLLLKLAECCEHLKIKQEAEYYYSKVIRDYPGSDDAKSATEKLEGIKRNK